LDAYELQRPAAEEAAKESEEIWDRVDDVTAEISTCPAVTLAGAMALLGEAVRQINVDHSDHEGNVGADEIEIGEHAVINAYETLVRLLPGSAVPLRPRPRSPPPTSAGTNSGRQISQPTPQASPPLMSARR
jgi:hypothetical protein